MGLDLLRERGHFISHALARGPGLEGVVQIQQPLLQFLDGLLRLSHRSGGRVLRIDQLA